MKDNRSIEQQVAELTQEQQDKLYKAGKIGTIFQLVGGIPWFIITFLGVFAMIDPPMGTDYDKLFIGFIIWLVLGAAYLIGILAFVKIKYPYYSDARWQYIHKLRKGK